MPKIIITGIKSLQGSNLTLEDLFTLNTMTFPFVVYVIKLTNGSFAFLNPFAPSLKLWKVSIFNWCYGEIKYLI